MRDQRGRGSAWSLGSGWREGLKEEGEVRAPSPPGAEEAGEPGLPVWDSGGPWCHRWEEPPWPGPDGSKLRSDWELRKESAGGQKPFGNLAMTLWAWGRCKGEIGG